jgi:hypothetical protein
MNANPITALHSRPSPRIIYGGVAVLLIGALVAILLAPGGGGWEALVFAVAPDVALLFGMAPGLARGQLHPRAVPLYNVLHSWGGPLLLGIAASLWFGLPLLAGAVAWAVHIAVDRAVGYGPRTPEGFQRG